MTGKLFSDECTNANKANKFGQMFLTSKNVLCLKTISSFYLIFRYEIKRKVVNNH